MRKIFQILIFFLLSTGIMQQDNSEQVILEPRLIAREYIRSWFFLDLISSVPLDYIFLIFNQVGFPLIFLKFCILYSMF